MFVIMFYIKGLVYFISVDSNRGCVNFCGIDKRDVFGKII